MIDYWCNAFLPDRRALWDAAIGEQGLSVKVRRHEDDSFADGSTMVARMDELGVDALILPCARLEADATRFAYERYATHPEELETLRAAHPDRFFGQWSIDPRPGLGSLERARAALADAGCVALHLHTHSYDRAFDHPDLEPFYALAAEFRVPMVMQAGASGGNLPHDCGRPSAIDRPAVQFPALDFVLSHTGAPWTPDAIAMTEKHPNVYLGTAAWPPHHWPENLVRFIGGAGRGKCLFGTSFPVVGHRHALKHLPAVRLGPEARDALLEGAARKVFRRLPRVDGEAKEPR